VMFHRARADEQHLGNLAAGFALGDEEQDAPFGGRERVEARVALDECRVLFAAL
jgi:hypothetical protein